MIRDNLTYKLVQSLVPDDIFKSNYSWFGLKFQAHLNQMNDLRVLRVNFKHPEIVYEYSKSIINRKCLVAINSIAITNRELNL